MIEVFIRSKQMVAGFGLLQMGSLLVRRVEKRVPAFVLEGVSVRTGCQTIWGGAAVSSAGFPAHRCGSSAPMESDWVIGVEAFLHRCPLCGQMCSGSCGCVSHHPPISAFHSEGLNHDFLFHGSIYPKLKFWGKSVEAEPRGTITLELLK
ncbi:hypothetical protein P7K49_010034 [Saguinus oedipus]|uniref:Uncharacterized protein n=1 Tax=Saguinus oedipus TaxID=9490 RepID=A0ABQ9VNY9_SAGOE|nr:hypothetical protein P7K49_010034 [Saguinus oedipus]